ncbi:uncharacterized protein N7483_012831 [Penicillium malachiteum]|uniref:uncharacterized protein n=1 Tax=Penicillium malachiteum TaxID=1324776 RepID=UPI002547C23D|nr:uncharacterized protein N7483_012831 [Penicillium malachiteum]KAJ5715650.1 hypothetical protein N7483_012831 [Penicillium malachiteum]
MNASNPIDLAEIARSNAAAHDTLIREKSTPHEAKVDKELIEEAQVRYQLPNHPSTDFGSPELLYPNEEELMTLRRVADSIPWAVYTVAFVELFMNFIQRPLPKGSKTGALPTGGDFENGVPAALGMGQRASTGLTLCELPCKSLSLSVTANGKQLTNFGITRCHLLALSWLINIGGRFKTIMAAIAATFLGHPMLICSAIPAVIAKPGGSISCFTIGLVIMGFDTGGFKPNISTLIGEQYKHERPFIRVLPSGERVIVDPAATISRMYLYFYLLTNLGSLVRSRCHLVNGYRLAPPTGLAYPQAFRLWGLAMNGRWSLNPMKIFKGGDTTHFWDHVKPSYLGSNKPEWMNLDDEWVDEVRRGLSACAVFLWYPLYWLAYNQMINNLTSQAATMQLAGVPNDIINNLNPLSLIIFIPIMDQIVYPGLRRMGIRFTPLKRITAGFIVAGCAMISATVTQHYIYKNGPCGHNANHCLEVEGKHTAISVWVQAVTYILAGISEIFASVTSLEYAFTKAPRNMRSLVKLFLFS